MNAEQFATEMNQIASRIEAIVPSALEECKPHVLENIAEHFVTGTSPDGESWAPRKNPGDGHPLLVETGALAYAATTEGFPGHVSRIEGDTLIVGVDKDGGVGGIPGAGAHNYGFPEKQIPQREFLGIDEETSDLCEEVLVNKVLNELFP